MAKKKVIKERQFEHIKCKNKTYVPGRMYAGDQFCEPGKQASYDKRIFNRCPGCAGVELDTILDCYTADLCSVHRYERNKILMANIQAVINSRKEENERKKIPSIRRRFAA